MDVSNPKAKDYKNALKKDPELVKGKMKYFCASADDAKSFIETNGKKDSKTTVTFTYTDMTAELEKELGSGAIMARATAIVALAYISYLWENARRFQLK